MPLNDLVQDEQVGCGPGAALGSIGCLMFSRYSRRCSLQVVSKSFR
jgi:hypothetical protein